MIVWRGLALQICLHLVFILQSSVAALLRDSSLFTAASANCWVLSSCSGSYSRVLSHLGFSDGWEHRCAGLGLLTSKTLQELVLKGCSAAKIYMCSEQPIRVQVNLFRTKILKFKWQTHAAWTANNLYNQSVNKLQAESFLLAYEWSSKQRKRFASLNKEWSTNHKQNGGKRGQDGDEGKEKQILSK